MDGGITNNTPIFPDGENRQLVFRLYEVEYPWRGMLQAVDTCIETLTLRGKGVSLRSTPELWRKGKRKQL